MHIFFKHRLYTYILTCCLSMALLIVLGVDYKDSLADKQERQYLRGKLEAPYRNLNIKNIQSIQTFLEAQDSFSFVVLGDSQRRHRIFREVLTEALQHDPDFIIHTGDLTTGGKYYQFMELTDFLEDYDIPIVFAVGNHDIAHKGTQCFTQIFGPMDFYFDVGTHRFIFINNNANEPLDDVPHLPDNYSGYEFQPGIDTAILGIVEELIDSAENTFIIMHQPPPVEPFLFRSFSKNADAFLSLMDAHNDKIQRVFCGHIHGYGEARYNGIDFVVTGGAGADLVKGQEAGGIIAKHNYVLVTVSGNTVSHDVYFLDDEISM